MQPSKLSTRLCWASCLYIQNSTEIKKNAVLSFFNIYFTYQAQKILSLHQLVSHLVLWKKGMSEVWDLSVHVEGRISSLGLGLGKTAHPSYQHNTRTEIEITVLYHNWSFKLKTVIKKQSFSNFQGSKCCCKRHVRTLGSRWHVH